MEMEELTVNQLKEIMGDQVLLNVQLQRHIERLTRRIEELEQLEHFDPPGITNVVLDGAKEGVTSGT